ncbi:MAG: cytochrome c [Acidobacteriota bacterium]|nr:MAG: cytochrome c [Acidobacteriota bacterium]
MSKARVSAGLLVLLVLPLLSVLLFAAGDAEQGKAAFMKRCKMCHGADGQGNPAMARMLKVEFKPMDSDYVQKKPDSEIKEIVTSGKGKMVAVRGVSGDELENIIAYIRTLKSAE